MNKLTHAEVSEMLLWANLSQAERRELRDHLANCPACRRNAAMHRYLSRELPRAMPASANTAVFRTRFLGKVDQVESRRQWAGPIYTLATTAMMVLLLALGWLFWSMQLGQNDSANLVSEPVATGAQAAIDTTPAASAATNPAPVAQGSVIVASIPAPSLQSALLEEPAEQTVAIYLPPSYDQSDRRYPVVYWLSTGEGPSKGPYGIGEAQLVMDKLLAAGQVQEMIVVVPPYENSYGNRVFYHNSPVSGNWADFLLHDVVGYVDANLRTIADAQARGLGGAAFTATNVLEIAMHYPGTFGAVYLKHPLLFAPGAMDESFITSPQSVQNVLALLDELDALAPEVARERLVQHLREQSETKSSAPRLDDMLTITYGMTYIPNPGGPAPYFDYLYTGEGLLAPDDIWNRWEQGYGQIPQKVARFAGALRQLDGLYIEYSPQTLSFSWSSEGSPYLAQQLEQYGIPFTLETYVGSAVLDTVSRMEQAMFPFFSETLRVP